MDLLRKTDFELFSLQPKFHIDIEALSASFRQLQMLTHPDRYAAGTDSEKRLSLQLTTRVNEAYQRLKEPIARGKYLCELRGALIQAETNTAMPAAFLMEQMQWREALDEPKPDVQLLKSEVLGKQASLLSDVERQLDRENNAEGAAASIRQLMFVEKFLQTIQSLSTVNR
jgi:molecular chaperone HscB